MERVNGKFYLKKSIFSFSSNVFCIILDITGYKLLRAGHASKSKTGGACEYDKSLLALRLIHVQYLL